MKCEAYRALIEEAAGRGTEPGGALGAHLGACAACREFRSGRESLTELLGRLERVGAPDDFEFRLRARMSRQRGEERSLLRRLRLAPGLAAAGLAACLLASAALYFRATRDAHDSVAAQQSTPAAKAPVESPTKADGVVGREQKKADEVAAAPRRPESKQGLASVTTENVSRRNAQRTRRAQREDTFGVRAASVIDGSRGRQLAVNNATPAVALHTSPETLRVVMRDERGGSYVLPMRSVTFGAQGPVSGGTRTVRASYTDKEGVW